MTSTLTTIPCPPAPPKTSPPPGPPASHDVRTDTRTPPRKRGRERLFSKRWLSVRHVDRFVAVHAHRLRGTGLDYGCGEKPYADLVTPHCTRLLCADVEPSARGVDLVFGRGATLPIATGALDFVLCTQVLEHVHDPGLVLHELARVLRPGGVLLLTVPFVWEQHEEPHDYYRFTRYALSDLATRAGFQVESLQPGGGMIEVLGQLAIHRLPAFGSLGSLVFPPLNLLAAALDRLIPLPGITCNWHAVLRR